MRLHSRTSRSRRATAFGAFGALCVLAAGASATPASAAEVTGSFTVDRSLVDPTGLVPAGTPFVFAYTVTPPGGTPVSHTVSLVEPTTTITGVPTGSHVTFSAPMPTPIAGGTWGAPELSADSLTIGESTTAWTEWVCASTPWLITEVGHDTSGVSVPGFGDPDTFLSAEYQQTVGIRTSGALVNEAANTQLFRYERSVYIEGLMTTPAGSGETFVDPGSAILDTGLLTLAPGDLHPLGPVALTSGSEVLTSTDASVWAGTDAPVFSMLTLNGNTQTGGGGNILIEETTEAQNTACARYQYLVPPATQSVSVAYSITPVTVDPPSGGDVTPVATPGPGSTGELARTGQSSAGSSVSVILAAGAALLVGTLLLLARGSHSLREE